MDLPHEAAAYAQADFAEVNAAFVQRLLEFSGTRAEAYALDLGTGPGDIPIRLVQARPAWRIAALDVSMPMLWHAADGARNAGVWPTIDLVQVDAKALPLRPDAFDVVFSNSILHHVSDTDSFWQELKRVAKPGAHVLVRDLARPETLQAADAIVEEYAAGESDLLREEFHRSLLAAYTPGEVRERLRRNGLATLEVAMVSDRHLDVFGRMP